MKSILRLFILILLPGLAMAQAGNSYQSSLQMKLKNAANDTVRMDINRQLGFYHQDSNPDSAFAYHEAQLALAKKLNLKLWEADAYQQIAYCYTRKYKFSEAFENYMLALKIVEDPSSALNGWGNSNFSYAKNSDEARRSIIGMIHFELSTLYNRTRYYKESFNQLIKALEIGESLNNQKILSLTNRDIGVYYFNNNQPDSAFIYLQKALNYYQNSPYQKNLGYVLDQIGLYYLQKKKYDSAKIYFRNAIDENIRTVSLVLVGSTQRDLARLYIETGQLDSALYYTLMGQKMTDSLNDLPGKAAGFTQLGLIYHLKKEYAIAYDYLLKGKELGDNIADAVTDRLMQFQNLGFDQKFRLQELEKENQQEKSRNRMYVMLMGLGIFLLVAILLYRNNRQKQKANKILEKTLADLKATQSQLIQSEKMASLGELTAGIAHEIQNPLNFVNNFSEINKELLIELNDELNKGEIEEAKTITKDVIGNEEKIIHHGRRADAIVKGMLQHSRAGGGQKEPTDVNSLCDEYLRLSFHGLRAKDKNFNAKFESEFDKTIDKINIIPQEIGRVILNLINNAFYAVNEKVKSETSKVKDEESHYKPLVIVSTKKIYDKVEISVKDNGNGIPDSIKEKIFQPFFTTKPTGSGTGLGLSLSYDIIKAHGGEIHVKSKENEGTDFIIQLPV